MLLMANKKADLEEIGFEEMTGADYFTNSSFRVSTKSPATKR